MIATTMTRVGKLLQNTPLLDTIKMQATMNSPNFTKMPKSQQHPFASPTNCAVLINVPGPPTRSGAGKPASLNRRRRQRSTIKSATSGPSSGQTCSLPTNSDKMLGKRAAQRNELHLMTKELKLKCPDMAPRVHGYHNPCC